MNQPAMSDFPAISADALNRPNGPTPTTAPLQDGLEASALGTAVRPLEPGLRDLEKIARAAAAPPQPQTLELKLESRFIREQEWLGRIEEVGDEYVRAVLIDMTSSSVEEEQAELSRFLISEEDEDLVVPGAMFYWVIGFRLTSKERRGESRVIFRRSLPWSDTERAAAEAEAKELWAHFGNVVAD